MQEARNILQPARRLQTVYVCSSDAQFVAACNEAGGALGLPVEALGTEALRQGNYKQTQTCAFVDVSGLSQSDLTQLAQMKHAPMVLAANPEQFDPIQCLSRMPGINNIYIKNPQQMTRQLHSILAKMQGGAWGLGSYLDAGTVTSKLSIADYGKKQQYINRVREFAAGIPNGFGDLPNIVATMAWELMMNGMFNAPRENGKPKYKDVSRSNALVVEPGEEIELEYGFDERALAIAVRDTFGTLTRETVVENLLRASTTDQAQVKRSSPGAGVGLYVLFTSASQLDFQIAPGRCTEVTAVIYLSKRYRDFARGGHSINFFVEE